MRRDKQPFRRRTVLKTIGGTTVGLSVGTGAAAARGRGNGGPDNDEDLIDVDPEELELEGDETGEVTVEIEGPPFGRTDVKVNEVDADPAEFRLEGRGDSQEIELGPVEADATATFEAETPSGDVDEAEVEIEFSRGFDETVSADDSIQEAIDEAEEGYTIGVESGDYEENVVVDVSGLRLEAVGDEVTIQSREPGEFEDSKPALLINADNVAVDGIDLVEGISPGNNQDVVEIADGVSGTTLTNLAVESPKFTGTETGHGIIGEQTGSIGDLTIENVEADRTIGLVAEGDAKIAINDATVTKSGDGSEAVFITGPGFGDADIDLTIEDVTPQDNEEETGHSTDLLLFGDEATINDVDGDAERLADAVFDKNADIDEVEIDGQVFTRT